MPGRPGGFPCWSVRGTASSPHTGRPPAPPPSRALPRPRRVESLRASPPVPAGGSGAPSRELAGTGFKRIEFRPNPVLRYSYFAKSESRCRRVRDPAGTWHYFALPFLKKPLPSAPTGSVKPTNQTMNKTPPSSDSAIPCRARPVACRRLREGNRFHRLKPAAGFGGKEQLQGGHVAPGYGRRPLPLPRHGTGVANLQARLQPGARPC